MAACSLFEDDKKYALVVAPCPFLQKWARRHNESAFLAMVRFPQNGALIVAPRPLQRHSHSTTARAQFSRPSAGALGGTAFCKCCSRCGAVPTFAKMGTAPQREHIFCRGYHSDPLHARGAGTRHVDTTRIRSTPAVLALNIFREAIQPSLGDIVSLLGKATLQSLGSCKVSCMF